MLKKMIAFEGIIILLICLCHSQLSYSQSASELALNSSLFEQEEVFSVSIKFNMKEVFEDYEGEDSHEAILYYQQDGDNIEIPLKVKVRGKTRADPKTCAFPPIRLNFKKNSNSGTVFAGQDKLKLVTHCNKPDFHDDYVLKEYLTYKHYNILTDYSFKVRLLEITYLDSEDADYSLTRHGFLIEEDEIMAKRNNLTVFEGNLLNQEFCEVNSLIVMCLFQYMIGNVDWSVPYFHNIKLIATEPTATRPIPVPYDFDYSGAIATNYAVPDESLGIQSVKTRVFRGFCRPMEEYQAAIDLFNAKKEQVYGLYEDSGLLSPRAIKSTLKYFDDFYTTINHPKRAIEALNGSCRFDHEHVR